MNDEMLEVVQCKVCGKDEYYGAMYWHNGKTMCRRCIYDVWYHIDGWKPGNGDYVFPLYIDGMNYIQR